MCIFAVSPCTMVAGVGSCFGGRPIATCSGCPNLCPVAVLAGCVVRNAFSADTQVANVMPLAVFY